MAACTFGDVQFVAQRRPAWQRMTQPAHLWHRTSFCTRSFSQPIAIPMDLLTARFLIC